jgi:hypothetical protein
VRPATSASPVVCRARTAVVEVADESGRQEESGDDVTGTVNDGRQSWAEHRAIHKH